MNYSRGTVWNGQIGNVTTVGSAGSTSFYGAFDMSGNLSEWNETRIGPSRGVRDASYNDGEFFLRSSFRRNPPEFENFSFVGFRLASPVPGPGSVAQVVVGAPLLARRRRR